MKNNVWLAILMAAVAQFGKASAALHTDASVGASVAVAQGIVLPEFKVDGVTFREAVIALHDAGKRCDPNHRGGNFLFDMKVEAKASSAISLNLTNVTLEAAAEWVARSAGVYVEAKDFAFVFHPKNDLGTVELVAGRRAQVSLGEGQYWSVLGEPTNAAIHIKWELLSTNANDHLLIFAAMGETNVLPGQRCEMAHRDIMVSFVPTLKTP